MRAPDEGDRADLTEFLPLGFGVDPDKPIIETRHQNRQGQQVDPGCQTLRIHLHQQDRFGGLPVR